MRAFGTDFAVPPGYLNTPSVGIPPAPVAAVVAESVDRWRTGGTRPGEFDQYVTRARAGFARLLGVDPGRVASGASVSQLVANVAAALPAGTRVLAAEGDFTSVTFPFAATPGVTVTEVPLDALPSRVEGHDVVALSVVQSADGRIADLPALRAAAGAAGAAVAARRDPGGGLAAAGRRLGRLGGRGGVQVARLAARHRLARGAAGRAGAHPRGRGELVRGEEPREPVRRDRAGALLRAFFSSQAVPRGEPSHLYPAPAIPDARPRPAAASPPPGSRRAARPRRPPRPRPAAGRSAIRPSADCATLSATTSWPSTRERASGAPRSP